MPWELYWAMGELVAKSKEYGINRTYSFSSVQGESSGSTFSTAPILLIWLQLWMLSL